MKHRTLWIVFLFFGLTAPIFASDNSVTELRKQAALYERGLIDDKDYTEAFRLYCLAALQRDAISGYSLGWMYFNGRGRRQNLQLAKGWFIRSARLGNKQARQMVRQFPNIKPVYDDSCPYYKKDMQVEHKHIETWVSLFSPEYDIDPKLVMNLIEVESAFNPAALSHKNAQGLMQLIPETASRFGVKDAWNPIDNIKGGLAYLQWLMAHFNGNIELMLAAYNAGESAVKKYRGIPPYRETQNYVRKIMLNYRRSKQLPSAS